MDHLQNHARRRGSAMRLEPIQTRPCQGATPSVTDPSTASSE